jgi:prolyl-tRNA editing enzyme YbaK/EbsC (Cys-tRNA(Pro) deacylase)
MDKSSSKSQYLTPETRRVQQFLDERGLTDRVVIVEEEILTASQTAKALGVTMADIAKSLLLLVDNNPVVVVVPGNKRVNFERLIQVLGAKEARLAAPEIVVETCGFDVRGVSPVAHTRPLPVFIDSKLAKRDVLYAAAGSHHAVFRTTYKELLAITKGVSIDLSS